MEMRCPYCQHDDSRVVDTRKVGNAVRRRRECLKCKQRFTTYERLASISLFVVKRDGRREPFDREKLARGIQLACVKRPLSQEAIETTVSQIESDLYAMGRAEVDSSVVGEMVMDELRKLDEVAYVRFASVYRRFEDVEALAEEISELRRLKRIREAGKEKVSKES
jgi:transcriptional repressor NrdR